MSVRARTLSATLVGVIAEGQIAGDTLLQVDVEVGDDSVQLRTEPTWIEPRDLDPYDFASIEGPGTNDHDRPPVRRPLVDRRLSGVRPGRRARRRLDDHGEARAPLTLAS